MVRDRGSSDQPHVGLTYDDGPGRSTGELLDLLARHRARATFFFVGSQVREFPEMAGRVVAEGHGLGSHTLSHLDHYEVDPQAALDDMVAGAESIAEVVGFEPTLYRAPYGHFIPETVAEAGRRGWTCVLWSTLGMDWMEGETGPSVAARIAPELAPGAIVLLHDARRAKAMSPEPVVGATEILLEEIERRGLRAVALGDML
jgi:peptidoglycan-N-acetylglucosamine deacetylase